MTKLLELVGFYSVLFIAWFSFISIKDESKVSNELRTSILYLPIYSALLIAVYSVFIVLWRVFTLKDCKEAAEELQNEIKQAKAELRSKGLEI